MLYPDFKELLQLAGRAPRPNLNTRQKTMAAAAGNYASPFRGQGLEFHEVREYRAGDDVRNIDWRVTARMNRPFMKVFTEERERTVLLCVNAGPAMRFGTRGTFKSIQAARAAALLGWMAQAGNDRVGALIFGDVPDGMQFIAPARSRGPLWRTLKTLCRKPVAKTPSHPLAGERVSERGISFDAKVSPSPRPSPPQGRGEGDLETALTMLERTAPTGALVFIISDFQPVTDSLEKILANLRRRCDIIMVSVTDPADRELPPMEAIWFSDTGGKRILAGTGSKKGRESYARQWRENRTKLEDMAVRQRVSIIDLHTNTDVYAELLQGLRFVEQRGSRR
jgi:uncharacterized protein (DUF58 family)